MRKIAREKFQNNEDNFFKRFIEIIVDDESPLDETTTVKVYSNLNEDGFIYFRFEIETFRMVLSTDYYRCDYIFTEGNKNNIDELVSNIGDVEIFTFFGDDISNPNNI